MTLYQVQGHRNEHQQICHAKIYRHAQFECHSSNIVPNITIIVHVQHVSSLRHSCDLECRQGLCDLERRSVWGSHCAKFDDDDDFNISFRGINGLRGTDRQTHTHTHIHTDKGVSAVNFQSRSGLWKKEKKKEKSQKNQPHFFWWGAGLPTHAVPCPAVHGVCWFLSGTHCAPPGSPSSPAGTESWSGGAPAHQITRGGIVTEWMPGGSWDSCFSSCCRLFGKGHAWKCFP